MSVNQLVTAIENQAATPDPLAAWRTELAGLDPRSHTYGELAQALSELATEVGITTMPDAEPEPALPAGFVALNRLVTLAEVPAEQFRHTVPALYAQNTNYVALPDELTTDAGGVVRVLDLRETLRRQVKDIDPPPTEFDHVDTYFFRDLKRFAEGNGAQNAIRMPDRRSGKVFYTRVNGSKMRAFWLPVKTNNFSGDGVRTVARVLDTGEGTQKERAAYSRIFRIILRNF